MQVAAADVSNATEIFGPNIDALKERTTERKEGTPIPLQDQQESRQHRQCMLISTLCSRSPTYTLKIAYQVTWAHLGKLPVQNRHQLVLRQYLGYLHQWVAKKRGLLAIFLPGRARNSAIMRSASTYCCYKVVINFSYNDRISTS